MAVVLTGVFAILYVRLGADLTKSIDQDLRSRAQVVIVGVQRADPTIVDARGHLIDPDEAFAQVLDPSGRIVDSSSGVSAGPILSAAQLQGLTRPAFFTRRVEGVDDPVRLLAVPGTLAGRPDVVVVGSTLGDRNEALIRLLLLLAVIGPIALVLVSLAGWLLAGAALRPVERMRREAAAISASEPDRRLPVPGTDDELARLGTTLNSMLDRLQESNERERRFVDDASHELRTPLSVLKMELDLALSRSRSIEELEASLSNASRETDRLVRLAQDLLVLARLEGGRVPVRRVEVPVGGLIREACAAQEDRARAIGVRIVAAADDGTARLDPVRVRQAIDNLIDNALRHAPEGSEIDVRAEDRDGSLVLSVSDAGPGFAEDFLPSATEPFTRADGSSVPGTARPGEGTGLGLAIVRAIAEAHGGTVTVRNAPNGGAVVTLLLADAHA